MTSLFMVTGTTILDDSIYDRFGGSMLSSSTPQQRQGAYQMAETFAALEIGTPLTPQSFTAIFSWWPNNRLQLPHKRLQSVTTVTGLHELACGCEPLELGGCAVIVDADNGVIDLNGCGGGGNCVCGWATGNRGGMAKRVEITYIAGVPAGLAASYAGVLVGLTIAADIALQQILDCSPDGDPSITNFSDSGYSETRQFLHQTAFGASARANYAARMFAPLKYFGALRMK
jgi:hypothetical protein